MSHIVRYVGGKLLKFSLFIAKNKPYVNKKNSRALYALLFFDV